MNLAKKMIEEAFNSGAYFAKFQTWSVSRLKAGEWDQDGRRDIYNKAELSEDKHIELINYCHHLGISFMSSAFSVKDASLLNNLKQKSVKIPSFEVGNVALLKFCDQNFEELIISTGTATKSEIDQISNLVDIKKSTIMHCVSSYPCGIENANLSRINYLLSKFPSVGYSDHVSGVDASIYALQYPLKYIEKHFTVDHELPGRDNKFAILPSELKRLTNHIQQRSKAFQDLGIDYQKIELSSRTEYRGRFNLSSIP